MYDDSYKYFVDLKQKDGLDMWRVWVRTGGCIGSWWGNRREGTTGET